MKPSFTDTSANLFASWKSWAELMGEPALSRKAFGGKLAGPGIEPAKLAHNVKGYHGICVVTAEPEQPYGRQGDTW
jgi:hypothetical protein